MLRAARPEAVALNDHITCPHCNRLVRRRVIDGRPGWHVYNKIECPGYTPDRQARRARERAKERRDA